MTADRQVVFPIISGALARSFADEPILIDGMQLEFDEKVALYPAAVEVVDDSAADGAVIKPSNGTRARRRVDG